MRNAVWDITSKCNLRCSHCFNAHKYFDKECKDMSLKEIDKLLYFLKNNKYNTLSLLGGEPLCQPHFQYVLEFCAQNEIEVAITTNGTMFSDDIIDFVVRESSVKDIMVSLDGSNSLINDAIRGNGTFDSVFENLIKLRNAIVKYDKHMSLSLSFCIFSLNLEDSLRMVDLAKQLFIENLSITPLIDSGNAAKKWNLYQENIFTVFDQIETVVAYASKVYPTLCIQIDSRPLVVWYLAKKYPTNIKYSLAHTKCQVLEKLLYIQADGYLHPCGFHSFTAGLDAQRQGYFNSCDSFSINDISSVEEIYNSKYYLNFIDSLKKLEKHNPHSNCDKCPVRNDCYPCPFQFSQGIAECDWAVKRINTIYDLFEKQFIAQKRNINSKQFKNDIELYIYSNIIEGSLLCDIYDRCNNSLDFQKVELNHFIDVIRNFQKLFFIKIKERNENEN